MTVYHQTHPAFNDTRSTGFDCTGLSNAERICSLLGEPEIFYII